MTCENREMDSMDFQIRGYNRRRESADFSLHSPNPNFERRPTLEDFLKTLGNPGRYQIVVMILLATNYIPVAVNHLLMAFYAVSTPHVCRALPLIDSNYSVSSRVPAPNGYSQCEMWVDPKDPSQGTQSCIHGYEFEFSGNEWTIVAEWGLVCDRKYVGPLITTIYFSGVMIGGVIFGYLSDRFGRKSVMLLCLYTQCLIGIAIHFVRRLVIFIGLRFIQGVFIQGLQSSTYSMVIELFSPQYRTLAGCVVEGFWATGIILLALISKYVQHWRYIQLAVNIPTIATIFYIWIIPESVRWLLSKGKLKKAEKIVRSIASYNSLRFDVSWLRNEMEGVVRELRRNSAPAVGVKSIFTRGRIRRNSMVLFFVWLSVSLSYYGISFSIPDLSGDIHLNFMIGGGIELAAYLFAFVVFNGFGRKYPLIVYLILSGIICISIAAIKHFVPRDSVDVEGLSIGLALIGKAAVVSCFCGIFIYSSELFPTILRTVANGSCAFWGRVGSLLAPQLLLWSKYCYPEAPELLTFCAFGGLSLLAGLLTILLPETYEVSLPDTIAEADQIGTKAVIEEDSGLKRINDMKGDVYGDAGYGKSPEWVEVDGMIVSRDRDERSYIGPNGFSTISSLGGHYQNASTNSDRSSAFSRATQEVIYETIHSSSSPEPSPIVKKQRPLPEPPKDRTNEDVLFHQHHDSTPPSSTSSSPLPPSSRQNLYVTDPTASLGDLSVISAHDSLDDLRKIKKRQLLSEDHETRL